MVFAGSLERGSLGVIHLKRYWARTMAARSSQGRHTAGSAAELVADQTLLSGLGLNVQETARFLFTENPSFEAFEQWIAGLNGGPFEPASIERLNAAIADGLGLEDASLPRPAPPPPREPALTASDLAFFDEHGYVIVHDAIPPEQCRASAQALWDFLGMDEHNPQTWYSGRHGHSIWTGLIHHPTFRWNRRSPRIEAAFAQLWNETGDLWPTIDQGGFNPPERPGWPFPGPHLHWDTSLVQPVTFGLQGILYLTDTAADQGAFTCVPGFQRRIEEWLDSLAPGADPREQNLVELGPKPIAGRAGDLIIWHHALPHGSSPNRSTRPRMVQYMNLHPNRWTVHPEWR